MHSLALSKHRAIPVLPFEKQGNELRFADNEKVNMNGIIPRK